MVVTSTVADINQGILEKVVHEIFAGEKIHSNVRKGADIRNEISGNLLELDVWIPSLHLCFEFQDPYHYAPVWDSQQPVSSVKQKDNYKQIVLRERNETLVVVPCWWDGTKESLGSTVQFHRSDLSPYFRDIGTPIPFNPPSNFFNGGLPGVGLLMLASFPSSVEFKSSISKSWWMGEKYDGARVCWNPERSQLYSRAGAEMVLPSEFDLSLSQVNSFFDAELWFGRGFFLYAQRVLTGSPQEIEFPALRLVAFDEPSYKQQEEEFEIRYSLLVHSIPLSHPFVNLAPRLLCNKKRQVKVFTQMILEDGGEGVVMRRRFSKYEPGRSPDLLKIKAARGDKEGMVIEIIENKAVRIKLPDRITFLVPFQKWNSLKPNLGDIVTFSYDAYSSNSIPTNPSIIRIRTDLNWSSVVRDHKESERQSQALNRDSKHLFGSSKFTAKPTRYWTAMEGRNMREVLDQFAKEKKFDPLVANNWYSISGEDMRNLQGSRAMLRAFKGNYAHALVALFPEVTFNLSRFSSVRYKEYKSIANRRLFFERFAKKQGFDPLVPFNWYSVKIEKLMEVEKDVRRVTQYHQDSHITALVDLFPDIGLHKYMFSHLPDKYWHDKNNQREFAIRVARECGFDPLVASNWYTIRKQNFVDYKGGTSFMQMYGGNKVKALMSIFPDIGLDPKRFVKTLKTYFQHFKHRRQFFEDYARRKQFDPLAPSAWYSTPLASIILTKGGRSVLRHYEGSLAKALQHLFPEINLDSTKFLYLISREEWATAQKRREFFESFARTHRFDPLVPSHWYEKPISYWLRLTDHAVTVCSHYSGDYVRALLHLFPEIGLKQIEFYKAKQIRKQFSR